jgi:hypothetical protein
MNNLILLFIQIIFTIVFIPAILCCLYGFVKCIFQFEHDFRWYRWCNGKNDKNNRRYYLKEFIWDIVLGVIYVTVGAFFISFLSGFIWMF